MAKIALVTEELSVFGRSGGIGAAFYELALVLADQGDEVDIVYVPTSKPTPADEARLRESFAEHGIALQVVDVSRWAWAVGGVKERAYAVHRHLVEKAKTWDVVHFHDYKGLGFFSTAAKEQGEAFAETTLVVQLHGPLRWTLHANAALFFHPDQLLIDHLERESIRLADHVVSPSRYLVDWMKANDFVLPPDDRVHVIKNVCSQSVKMRRGERSTGRRIDVRELIFFGRHERRKGIVSFCEALDRAAPAIEMAGVSVCFLGGLGELNGMPSGVFINERARSWTFPLEFRVDLDRRGALAFLASRPDALVVIPSSAENSPYTVVEAMSVGRPVLTSLQGGARELIAEAFHDEAVVETDPVSLAARITALIEGGVRVPDFAEQPEAIAEQWIAFHRDLPRPVAAPSANSARPKVVLGITHFERPDKVIGAIVSALRQTYDNLEIVVVDDGSRSEATRAALPRIRKMLQRAGGRLLERENGYLGAARNTIAQATQSDYLLFLDDDDLLFPDAVERMVGAATRTGAEVVNCLNCFLDVGERPKYELAPETWPGKASYVPLGGPLSLAHLGNHFGAATALLRRDFFEKIGGYTEIQRVGYEDYELFLRVVQAGGRVVILPAPLYLYEVGKPSMISATSRIVNKRRVFEAIDFAAGASAWRDALELATGAETVADEANHAQWARSLSPHRELLERLVSPERTLSEKVEDLAAHARAVGSPGAAVAWGDATRRPDDVGGGEERRVRVTRGASGGAASSFGAGLPLEMSDVLASWSLGRVDTAAREFAEIVARRGEVARYHVDCLHLLIAEPKFEAETATLLLDALSGAWVDRDAATDLRGVLGLLAAIADRHSEARDHLGAVEAAEADDYVRLYPDLAEAFGEAARSRALRHYHDYGHGEGRSGFRILARVAETYGRRHGRRVSPFVLTTEIVVPA